MLLLQLLQLYPGKGNNKVPQGIPKVLKITSAKNKNKKKKKKMLEIILTLQKNTQILACMHMWETRVEQWNS